MRLRRRAYQIVEPARFKDRVSLLFDFLLITLILISVLAFIFSTVDELNAKYGRWFNVIEIVSVSLFTIEYIIRLWCCTTLRRYRHPVGGRVRYALRPMMIIDLLAISPTFLLGISGMDGQFLKAVRLLRVLRLMRLSRYSESLNATIRVLRRRLPDLLAVFVVLGILLTIFSTLMYVAENQAQPEAFGSIPDAMWWGIVTLTTVGYGDLSPVTPIGKVIGGVVAVLGIGFFAIPTGILAAGFSQELERIRERRERRARRQRQWNDQARKR